MLLHYLVNALSESCMWNRWPSAPRNTARRYLWHPNIPDLNPVDFKIWVIMQLRVYQTKICNVDERRVIDVWCGLKQSTTNTALITSVEDFERASIRKEDNYSNTTCELTLLILSVSVTFSVTFVVWLLPCYIFHSKSVPATSTIGLQDCLFYKVVQRQNHAVWHAEKIIKIG